MKPKCLMMMALMACWALMVAIPAFLPHQKSSLTVGPRRRRLISTVEVTGNTSSLTA